MPRRKCPENRIRLSESPGLRCLTGPDRRQSIGALHLTSRAANALVGGGVYTLGDLIDLIYGGSEEFPSIGEKAVSVIQRALSALSKSILPDGTVDWLGYASRRNFLILPAKGPVEWSFADFAGTLPTAAHGAIESMCGHRERLVFKTYILQREPRPVPPTTLARGHQGPRQAALLMKEKMVRLLRRTMLEDEYTGCHFRFQPAFVMPLRRLSDTLLGLKS